MPDPPPAVSASADETTLKDGGSSRSRVYIACTLCRQRKIKCGGEQPSCRNCGRSDLECHYDTEPKRRGPDKKPGTRIRTRKDSTGTILPPKSRVSRLPQPPSSTDSILVPSQVGPTRNRKRPPRGSTLEQIPHASFGDEQARLLSNDTSNTNSIRKISPPTLPRELEQLDPTSYISTSRPSHKSPEFGLDAFKERVSPSVRLPQLPNLVGQAVLRERKTSSASVYLGNIDQISARCDDRGQSYSNNNIVNLGGGSISDDLLTSGSATHPSNLLSATSPRSDHPYVASGTSSDSPPGLYVTSSIELASSTGSLPLGLSTAQPASPVFTRLQHTHDPNFQPPTDFFAGLAYPRVGIIVPALERSGGLPNSAVPREAPGTTLGASRTPSELEADWDRSSLGGDTRSGTLATQDVEGISGELIYRNAGHIRHHAYELPASNTEGSGYPTPDEHVYDNYERNYPSHSGGHHRSPSGSSYSTQADAPYPPLSGSSYATSVDSYVSRSEGYMPMGPTPTEITILPPPTGGSVSAWNEHVDDAGLYDEETVSVGYSAETYATLSGIATPSSEYEATLAESENTQTSESTFSHCRYPSDLVRRMLYKNATSWVLEPSTTFMRKTWWDGLLEMYAPTKAEAAQQITFDLKYLFKSSNYWLSFLNVNLFMTNYNHRERRENIQPSLILAALAYSTFTQSSEIEKGHDGRMRAMELRNHAQAALEASLNSQRLDPTLAQAAWLLALFEVSAHPEHSTARSRSALVFLDNIIRLLGLTTLDVMDPNVQMFSLDQVPRLELSPRKADSSSSSRQYPLASSGSATCSCHALSIASTTSHLQMTPFWVSSPGWDPTWSEVETHREESRRLVWSSLILAAGFTAHDAAFAKDPTELHLIHASNYALCFPGEVMLRGVPNAVHSPQESVWALYARAMMLWNSCLTLRKKAEQMTDTQRAEFAVNVWLETNTIEEALNRHTCEYEKNTLFQGREFLFNTRMFISWEFRRYIPSPDTEVHQKFHRRKAEEWLRHQAQVAKRLMHGLHTVTGMASNVLSKRPYFVWWFMAQVSRCLSLWQCDQSLFIALEVAQAFLPPIDYLTCLWPCPVQRSRYCDIRQRLHDECLKYGLAPPQPLQLVIPTAALI